jgi:GNAT superfamily N-acetyltransferase
MPPGGTWVRPIAPADKALLQDGLQRLSRETIERRFLAAKPRFTEAELRYLTEIDGRDHMALVVLDDGGGLVAVGRSVRTGADAAELAVVVGDCWQRRGVGTELARRLAAAMAANGVTRISGTMLATNRAALRLMRALGPVESSGLAGSVREVVVRVGAPVALAA